MSPPQHASKDAGFTLIDMLAALAVTVALAGAALPAARNLIFRWHAASDVADATEAQARGLDRIRDDFSETLPVVESTSTGEFTTFAVAPDCATLVRRSLGGIIGLERITYSISSDAKGFFIKRSTRPWSMEQHGVRERPLVVFTSAEPLRFEATVEAGANITALVSTSAVSLISGSEWTTIRRTFQVPAHDTAKDGKQQERQLTCD